MKIRCKPGFYSSFMHMCIFLSLFLIRQLIRNHRCILHVMMLLMCVKTKVQTHVYRSIDLLPRSELPLAPIELFLSYCRLITALLSDCPMQSHLLSAAFPAPCIKLRLAACKRVMRESGGRQHQALVRGALAGFVLTQTCMCTKRGEV